MFLFKVQKRDPFVLPYFDFDVISAEGKVVQILSCVSNTVHFSFASYAYV